jgi:hypothetical protein
MNKLLAIKLRNAIETASVSLDDSIAYAVPQLYKKWEIGIAYLLNERVSYNSKLYKVIQPHTSQIDWPPTDSISLFVEVFPPDVIPLWKQPLGAHDTYNTGDKVHFPTITDFVYQSNIDNNSWSPTDYPAGWTKL